MCGKGLLVPWQWGSCIEGLLQEIKIEANRRVFCPTLKRQPQPKGHDCGGGGATAPCEHRNGALLAPSKPTARRPRRPWRGTCPPPGRTSARAAKGVVLGPQWAVFLVVFTDPWPHTTHRSDRSNNGSVCPFKRPTDAPRDEVAARARNAARSSPSIRGKVWGVAAT